MVVDREKQGSIILKFLLIASIATLFINFAILLMPTGYRNLFYGTIQFLWPLMGILLLLRIRQLSEDRNIRFFTGFFALGLIPWTLTILLWEVLLPVFYDDSLAYYVTGFGFLLCYILLIAGLRRIKHTGKGYLSPSTNSYINILGIVVSLALLAFILTNISWGSPHLPDILILVLYLVSDVAILTICSKLINTDLKVEMKYLVFVVGGFVLINSVGDLLFEMRWLLSLKFIDSIPITDIIDPVYNVSLIFMVAALGIYGSGLRDRALAEMRKKLDDTRLFVDDIMANAPDAMFVCDRDGNFVQANGQMLRMFGIKEPDALQKVNIFERNKISERVDIKDISAVSDGQTVSVPRFSYRHPASGCQMFLSLKLFPIFGTGREVQNYFGIIEDITGRLQTEEALMESRKQIELYVDLMGHDINNMNQIGIGFLEMAREKLSAEGTIGMDSSMFIDRPLEAFRNSSRLISNIKKMRKVMGKETGLEPVDAGKTIEDAIAEYRYVPDRQIVIDYTPVQGLIVNADGLLKDVFSNLIGNAIKHSLPEKPLSISITAVREAKDGLDCVMIDVEDNGPGIEDSRKSEIFDRFSPGTIKARGRGLGLYLVRTLVESYGGSVRVEDRVPGDCSQGSRFVVLLPAYISG
jgi:PAS domain S-box-containing protein